MKYKNKNEKLMMRNYRVINPATAEIIAKNFFNNELN